MGIFYGNKSLGIVYFAAKHHFMQLIDVPFLDVQGLVVIKISLPFLKISAEIQIKNLLRKTYARIEMTEISDISCSISGFFLL